MVANGSEQMGHRRHGHDRHDHGRSGREYRQRRPPADERHVGRHDRGNHVGRDRLHALQRLCHAAHRLAVGPLRAQADVRRERLAVHGRLDVLRPGAHPPDDGDVPRASGGRGRGADDRFAGDPAGGVSSAPAGGGDGRVRDGGRARARPRSHAGRLAHRPIRLAVDLLRQRPDRRSHLLLVQRFIADPPYLVRERGRVDVPGIALLALGLGALQLMLEEGQRKDWFDSSFIVTLGAAAGLGLALFIWRELATARPAVDLRILKSASFSSATALGGVLGMGLYGSLFLLPLFLQNLLGNPAETAGLALMPRSLAMAVVMPIGGLLYNRLGPRLLIAAGLLVSAFSFQELSHLTIVVGFWDVFVRQLWQGVGFSLIFVALSTAALGTIEKAKMTAAAGLYNVVRQVFGSVGIAVAATTLTTGIARYHDSLAEHVTMYDPTTRQWLATATAALRAAGSDAYTASRRALDLLNGDVTRQAVVLSYNHVFALVMLLFAIALPLVLLLRATGAPRDEAAALIGE